MKKGNPKIPWLFVISFCRRCCGRGAPLRVSLLLCRVEMPTCGVPVRLWPQVTEVTEPEAWGNSSPASFHLSINRAGFSWYIQLMQLLCQRELGDSSQLWSSVERIPKEEKDSSSSWLNTGCKLKSLAASQRPTYNLSACDRSFSSLRNLSSTTLHLVSYLGDLFCGSECRDHLHRMIQLKLPKMTQL